MSRPLRVEQRLSKLFDDVVGGRESFEFGEAAQAEIAPGAEDVGDVGDVLMAAVATDLTGLAHHGLTSLALTSR